MQLTFSIRKLKLMEDQMAESKGLMFTRSVPRSVQRGLTHFLFSMFHIRLSRFFIVCIVYFISSRTKAIMTYDEFSNLKRIEKNLERSSIKPRSGFDREDMK